MTVRRSVAYVAVIAIACAPITWLVPRRLRFARSGALLSVHQQPQADRIGPPELRVEVWMLPASLRGRRHGPTAL